MSDHDTREARATLARQRFAPGASVSDELRAFRDALREALGLRPMRD